MADNGKVNIHGKEYLTVAYRVNAFRETYQQKFSIETHLVSADDKLVVMKAYIRDTTNDKVIATGYAEENRTSSQINRTSALENCETSAIGRALAAFGLAGTEYASADEVARAISQQGEHKPAHKTGQATENQRKFVKDLCAQMAIAEEDIPGFLAEDMGVEVPLTFEGAQFVIEELKGRVRHPAKA